MKKTALWILLSLMTVSLSWAQDKPAQASSDETPASTLSPEEQEAITQAVNEAVSEKLASTQSPSGSGGYPRFRRTRYDWRHPIIQGNRRNAPVVRPGATAGTTGNPIPPPRNSRLSFLAQVPDMDGWKNKGYLELDFLGYDPAPNYPAAAATGAAPVRFGSHLLLPAWHTHSTRLCGRPKGRMGDSGRASLDYLRLAGGLPSGYHDPRRGGYGRIVPKDSTGPCHEDLWGRYQTTNRPFRRPARGSGFGSPQL